MSLDPEFGKASAWLAIVRTYLTIFGYVPPAEVIPAARKEAQRAIGLERDPAVCRFLERRRAELRERFG